MIRRPTMIYKQKKADTNMWWLVIGIIAILIIGYLIWNGTSGRIKKLSTSLISFLKDKIGMSSKEELDKQKEAERVNKELADNAAAVYEQFQNMVNNCGMVNTKPCTCGNLDFTKLNDYSLKISNTDKGQIIELLDSSLVSVKGKNKNIGTYVFLYPDMSQIKYGLSISRKEQDCDTIQGCVEQSRKINFAAISSLMIKYNTIEGPKELKDNLNKVRLVKLANNVYEIDNLYTDTALQNCVT